MEFFLEMIPPTVTAQMHKVTIRAGKPRFYDTAQLKAARSLFLAKLQPYRPIIPWEGPILLTVLWSFPTKTHKDGSYRITRPDTDNLQKLLKDCMTTAGYWQDDAQVCIEIVTKRWTRTKPGIRISIQKLEQK